MTDPTPEADTSDRTQAPTTRGMPRWVKISLLVVAGLIVLVVTLNLVGVDPGGHGPMRHIPGGDVPASSPGHGPAMHDR